MVPPAPTLGPPGPADIRRAGSAAAKARDGHACIFTGTSDPAAAHVFPFATSAGQAFQGLNIYLQFFWGDKRAMAWRRQYQDANITQSPQNLISMNHHLHFWFDNARFALKPLRQTRNEIVLQWHWLRYGILKPRTMIKEDQDLLVQAGLTDQVSWGTNLAHRKSGVRIQTGQTFVIRAENPEDLPSFELLELQWDLLRVAAICGAAEATDEDYGEGYDTDDEAVPILGGPPTAGHGETMHDSKENSRY